MKTTPHPIPLPQGEREYNSSNVSPSLDGKGGGWKILLSLLILHLSLFTSHFSLSFAESLSDIKIDALQTSVKPIEEKWGRDPFIKYEDKKLKERPLREEVPLDLKVDGIISDGKKALAIINGGFYRKHEMVNNFLIVDIERDKVLLEKNGKRFYLGIEKFAIESTSGGQRIGKK